MACEKRIRQKQADREKQTPALMRLREESSRLARRIKSSEKGIEAARREAEEQVGTLGRVEADLRKLRAAKVRGLVMGGRVWRVGFGALGLAVAVAVVVVECASYHLRILTKTQRGSSYVNLLT